MSSRLNQRKVYPTPQLQPKALTKSRMRGQLQQMAQTLKLSVSTILSKNVNQQTENHKKNEIFKISI